MESSLVIKVKYGDTLRRFSARLNENNQLDLNMVGLKAKICSLFNFTADANLMLRYVDEDGDLVTLVDDDDLNDMMRQSLPFLRIDVHMSNDSGGKSNASSSGYDTPLRSPHVPDLFRSGNVAVADVWKSVQEPLNNALSNLLLVSKAVSSASPVLANLAETISKVGKPILNSHIQPHVAAGPSSKNGAPGEHATSETKGPKSTYGNPTFADFFPKIGKPPFKTQYQPHVTTGPSSKNCVPSEPARVPQPVYGDSTSGSPFHAFADFISKTGKPVQNSHYQWPHVVASVPGEHVTPEERGPQSTYVDPTSNASQPVEAGNVISGAMERDAPVDLNVFPFDPYSSQSGNVNITPLSSSVPDIDGKKGKASTNDSFAHKGKISGSHKGKIGGTSSTSAAPNNGSTWTSSSALIKTPIYICDSAAPLGKISGTSSRSIAPNNGSTFTSSTAFIKCPIYTCDSAAPSLGNFRTHPFKRSHIHVMAQGGMFHKGVRCDGCGVYPIIGPRFKSKVKENYDLCSICFNTMGNVTEYSIIDRLHPGCFPTLPTSNFLMPELDSRFILDVTVIDGTIMAPSTAFTKIWRICNNGTLVWPMGIQLVWIGGDNFSDSHSVDLEIPEEGVPVEKELDIAVDFIAPPLPGQYISYWRMASPSGQKFGQRVWVRIQVDASLKDSFYDSSQGLNLNIPLDVSGSKGPQIIDINVQPAEDDAFLPHILNAPTVPVNELVDNQQMRELVNDFNEATVVAAAVAATSAAASAPATSAAASLPATSVAMVDNQLVQKLVNHVKLMNNFNEATVAAAAATSSVASAPATSAAASLPATSVVPSSVSYPIIDLSETTPAVPSNQQSAAAGAPSPSLGVGESNSVEETLLKELEEMGFKQVDLNKEILRMNEYNLEQSVDDLCSVSECDPILEELHLMF